MDNQIQTVIVDDDEVVSSLLEDIFSAENIASTCFTDANAAFEYICTHPSIHVVISDINMPDASGYELCRKIVTHSDTMNIPVLLISSSLATETILNSYESGCFDFLRKPIDPDEIINKVKKAYAISTQINKIHKKAIKSKATAFQAMKDSCMMQSIIQLAESCRHLLTLSDLSFGTFETLEQNNIAASVMFYKKDESWFFSSDVDYKPLENKLLESILRSNKANTSNRFLEINGRLFVIYETLIAFVKHSTDDQRDYIANIFNIVNSQAKYIFSELKREDMLKEERRKILAQYEQSITQLNDIFSLQMGSLSDYSDIIISELSVILSSIDICEHTEEVIFNTIKNSLDKLSGGIIKSSQIFEQSSQEMLSNLNNILDQGK